MRGCEETAQGGLQESQRRANRDLGNSPVAQWLRTPVSTARGPGLILGQGTMTLQAVRHGKNQTETLD